MLLIAIMLALVSITQIQNVLMDALVVITTSEFDVLTHILDSSDLTVYIDRFSDEVRRTLTDICFEKYNQILVLNQYDITKGPIAKLFGRDGFEKPDLQFDFGTVTDLKVRDFFTTIHFPTILHLTVTERAGSRLPKSSKMLITAERSTIAEKIAQETPPEIQRRIFWCNKIFPKKKFFDGSFIGNEPEMTFFRP